MTKVTIRLEIDLVVVIEDCHLEIELEVDSYKIMDKITYRITEEDWKTTKEMTLGEEITGRHKIIEVRIIGVDIETITETCIGTIIETTIELTTLEEAEVGLEKDITLVTLEGMMEVVAELHQVHVQDKDPDLVQELIPVEIELGLINAEYMTILPMTVLIWKKMRWTD